jgi:hypothetical protein
MAAVYAKFEAYLARQDTVWQKPPGEPAGGGPGGLFQCGVRLP